MAKDKGKKKDKKGKEKQKLEAAPVESSDRCRRAGCPLKVRLPR